MTENPCISVVSPVYRAELILSELVLRIETALEPLGVRFEILLVEDFSPDGSWSAIENIAANNPRVKGIKLSRNFGQHAAIMAGIEHAEGDWVVVMDCDLQDRPDEIPNLYKKSLEGYDIVLARRSQRQDNWIKKSMSRSFYKVLSYFTGTTQDHTVANFGIYSRRSIQSIIAMGDYIKYFPSMVRWVGHRVTSIEVKHSERFEGKSTYSTMRLIGLALNVMLSFSSKPILLLTRFGIGVSFLALLFVIYNIILYFMGEIVILGYTSLISSLWFFSGVIITTIGIVGMYVGRIFDQTKNRPVYLVGDTVNLK